MAFRKQHPPSGSTWAAGYLSDRVFSGRRTVPADKAPYWRQLTNREFSRAAAEAAAVQDSTTESGTAAPHQKAGL